MYMGVLPTYSLRITFEQSSASRGQKSEIDPWEVKLQTVESCHMGSGNETGYTEWVASVLKHWIISPVHASPNFDTKNMLSNIANVVEKK